jgi:hypothetical protein
MADSYPPEVSTFKVVGRLGRGVADSADNDQAPDLIPIQNAEIVFTPEVSPPIIRVPGASEPLIIFLESVVATTDSQGYLKVWNDSARGVVLPWGLDPSIEPSGWTWRVRISVGGSFPPISFSIAGSPGGVFDVSSLVPVPSNPGAELDQWLQAVSQVQQIKTDVLEIRDQISEEYTGTALVQKASVIANKFRGVNYRG